MIAYARALDFRPDAALELSGKAVALVLSVAIAATTGSHWAIAAATVGAPLATTLLSYAVAPLRPRLTLEHWPRFSDLVGWNFLAQAGAALNWQIDRLILPRLTTTAMFGQYAMGKQIAEIPVQALIQPLFRPTLTALAEAHAQRRSRYLQLSHAVALVMVPVMGVTLLWPDVLVRAALGPDWSPAAQWLRCIGAITLLGLPGLLVGPLAMTLDRTRWIALRTLVELALRLPLVGCGAVAFGIPGAIAGSAVATAAGTWVALGIVRRLLDVGPARQLASLGRPLLALLPAGAVLRWAQPLVMQAESPSALLLRALPVGVAYLAIYTAAVFLGWRLVGRPAGLERHVAGVAHRFFARTRRIPRAADDAPAAPSRRPPPTQPATATEGHVEPPR
jgi:O-antigen/teichoic acid export membrane protein